MPFSAIDPEVHGDVARIRIGTNEAQVDLLGTRLIEYYCASYKWRHSIVIQVLKISGGDLPGSGTDFISGCRWAIGGDIGVDKVCRINGTYWT